LLLSAPSFTLQPFAARGFVSFHPSRFWPLKSLIGAPNLIFARSGAGGKGGVRLPVNSALSNSAWFGRLLTVIILRLSPSLYPVTVSVVTATGSAFRR